MSEFLVIVLSVLVVYLTICILVQKKIITLLKNRLEEYIINQDSLNKENDENNLEN